MSNVNKIYYTALKNILGDGYAAEIWLDIWSDSLTMYCDTIKEAELEIKNMFGMVQHLTKEEFINDFWDKYIPSCGGDISLENDKIDYKLHFHYFKLVYQNANLIDKKESSNWTFENNIDLPF